MKKEILYMLLIVGLFFSCSVEKEFTESENPTDNTLKLNVTKTEFYTPGSIDTRVTNSGLITSFKEGDIVGVLVSQERKNYNLPYRFVNGKWEYDNTLNSDMFVKNDMNETLEYIVYYPYSKKADNVTSVEDLAKALPVIEDQSTEENYIVSDVLYKVVLTDKQDITVTLEHLRSLFAYSIKGQFTATVQSVTGSFDITLDNLAGINFYSQGKRIKCFKISDWEYRYIFDSNRTISWEYEYQNIVYENSQEFQSIEKGNKYTIKESIPYGVYDISKTKVGDLYCVTSGDNPTGFVYPVEAYSSGEDNNSFQCIGVIFHLGVGNGDNQADYTGTDIATNGIKGYVVALKDAGYLQWATSNEIGIKAVTEKDRTKWNAFKDLSIVKSQTLDMFPAFSNCVNFSVSSTVESSGWYLPSYAQLGEIFKSKNILKESFNKLPGSQFFKEDWYWSSTQSSNNNQQALMYYMKDSGASYDWDKQNGYNVRPVLTF